MKPEGLLPKELATGLYPESDEFSPHLLTLLS
jgi:hypothetical protein